MKVIVALSALLALAFPVYAETLPTTMTSQTKDCLECHAQDNTGLYEQWGGSAHYRANVGCYECHKAKKGEVDALRDGIHDDFVISTLVTPTDCARCHEREVDEFINSHHAKAGFIMGSLDNLLAEVVEGNNGFVSAAYPEGVSAAAVNGCWQCHGSEIKVDAQTGKLDPATWPNSGMGRINPDGSTGSCSACHSRHSFSVAQARQPENCGKCHMGPDHPQIEIYNESKHGIAYRANVEKMNLDSPKWIVGEDYNAAPTCATCHMSATGEQPVTHNVGLRIKWNNRPVHSVETHLMDARWGLESAKISGDQRRENMIEVCLNCHQQGLVGNFFIQYEGLLDLYENKFAVPGERLYKLAQAILNTDPTYAKFSRMIDYTWFEIWHHEGRRARHAASMGGPDYTHWHGTYEIAKHFYAKYIPELRELIEEFEHKPEAKTQVAALKKGLKELFEEKNHQWAVGKEDLEAKARRKKAADEFKARYIK